MTDHRTRGGQGALAIRIPERSESRGREGRIARVGDDAEQRLRTTEAAERANGRELDLVLLVREREDDCISRGRAVCPSERVDGRSTHFGIVVGERPLMARSEVGSGLGRVRGDAFVCMPYELGDAPKIGRIAERAEGPDRTRNDFRSGAFERFAEGRTE